MKQLSLLTKVMFGVVAVLLIITVGLGIATVVKENKVKANNKDTQMVTSVTPKPNTSDNVAQNSTTPEPTAEPTETPTPTPEVIKHYVCIDPAQQAENDSEKEPVGPGAADTISKMSYNSVSVTTKTKECEITLKLAKVIGAELESRGYGVIYTRDSSNVKISNAERAQLSNKSDAEVLLQLQLDSSETAEVAGVYTNVPSKENQFVKNIAVECRTLAEYIHNSVIANTGAADRKIREKDDMAIINYSKVPVGVFTVGFLTNPDEDAKLQSEEYQKLLAKAFADALDDYFAEKDSAAH